MGPLALQWGWDPYPPLHGQRLLRPAKREVLRRRPNCTQRASCILCGAKYGKTDPTCHASLEKLEAIAATAAANGRVECWHCTACDKYFADANGKTELTAENTVTEKVPPSIIQGNDARWKKGESSTLTFRSDAAFEDFAEVLVDGAVLPSESYEKRNGEGNIIVELRESYLEQLAEGEHTLVIRSARGDAHHPLYRGGSTR